MSRLGGDQIVVKPTNNIYTMLAAVGLVAAIIAYISMWMAHSTLFGTGLFS